MAADPAPQLCNRCKEHDATLDLRSERVCSSCQAAFVTSKVIKRLIQLQRDGPVVRALAAPATAAAAAAAAEHAPPQPPPRRYLVAVSRGPSSAALLALLCDNQARLRQQRQQQREDAAGREGSRSHPRDAGTGSGGPLFELDVVHVVDDTLEDGGRDDGETPSLDELRAAFPGVPIRAVPLAAAALAPRNQRRVDWEGSLPLPPPRPAAPGAAAAAANPAEEEEEEDGAEESAASAAARRLSAALSALPSASARADARRQLTRHVLAGEAARSASTSAANENEDEDEDEDEDGDKEGRSRRSSSPPRPPSSRRSRRCDALLLGRSTTALAELALAECARGRGFQLPWLAGDGVPVSFPDPVDERGGGGGGGGGGGAGNDDQVNKVEEEVEEVPVYSPLRDLFRGELRAYLRHARPGLAAHYDRRRAGAADNKHSNNNSRHNNNNNDIQGFSAAAAAVVSHRDLTIDDVVSRFFADVEPGHPSVVANVARTTGKLLATTTTRADHLDHDLDRDHDREGNNSGRGTATTRTSRCGLCGAGRDAAGDARWRGEIGDNDHDNDNDNVAAAGRGRLCYGCERTVRG
ncbi:hypothetical protein GGR56DRAFT_688156 [Xylariaceae sp. FL0804]|nr:hypothetical protein GGR56DRAFT_688156 [Xylariaceae sp. FL0804]